MWRLNSSSGSCHNLIRTTGSRFSPGDDAAVLRLPGGKRTVVTTDMLTESVDFRFSKCQCRQGFPSTCLSVPGWQKSRRCQVSAISPRWQHALKRVVVSVALPRLGGRKLAEELFNGIQEEVDAFDVTLAGGDTNAWDGPLVISVTAIGSILPRQCWRRDAARPGDLLVVTGPLGGSLLGRHLQCHPSLP